MYDADPIWKQYYSSRRIVLFLKQYTDTLAFKVSSPLSTIFWIISSIPSNWVGLALKILALGSLLGPACYFKWRYSPFNVKASWDQISPQNQSVERANHRGHVFLEDGTAKVRVRILFDQSVESYSLKFEPDHPLSVSFVDKPDNSDYDGEDHILSAENVDNVKFYIGMNIELEKADFVYQPELKIKDAKKDTTLLKIGIA